jgi:hypothetical protein
MYNSMVGKMCVGFQKSSILIFSKELEWVDHQALGCGSTPLKIHLTQTNYVLQREGVCQNGLFVGEYNVPIDSAKLFSGSRTICNALAERFERLFRHLPPSGYDVENPVRAAHKE